MTKTKELKNRTKSKICLVWYLKELNKRPSKKYFCSRNQFVTDIFDCCYTQPSIHPSTHPHKTRLFSFAETLNRLFCSKLFHFCSPFPHPLQLYSVFPTFWNNQILIFLYKNRPPLKILIEFKQHFEL